MITKNKGADGKYYKMFMDDSLQIRPSDLDDTMDNQLDMFTMEHENQYGEMMNELINIFIPPENATKDEMDEAKRNMDKYADYRTYLSFDMQQIVHGDKEMTIGLSKMIKKNSGGEGQNPLYVALLASFAQLIRSICRRRCTGHRHCVWLCWTRRSPRWMPRRWQAVSH